MKRCSECGKEKSDFGPDRRASDGLQSACRTCNKKRDSARYAKESERRRKRQRVYWNALPAEERTRRSRAQYLRENYGIDTDAYEALLASQNGVCALCFKPPSGRLKSHQRLQVDHDHQTGEIRGLLCNECNTAIGRLGDSVAGLQNALRYLTDAKERVSAVLVTGPATPSTSKRSAA